MGVFRDETFTDALKLALAAGILSQTTPYTFPGQMPVVFLAPTTHYDFMNPTTTNPFTSLSSAKTLRPSYVAIPLYAIVPFPTFQAQPPPPQSIPSPHQLNSAFWDVVNRTVEYSVHGTMGLVWLLSKLAEAVSQKVRSCGTFFSRSLIWSPYSQDLYFLRDDRQPSCDLFDLEPLPAEDDLLRLDISGLESIPLSELYLGEGDKMTVAPTAPRPVRLARLIQFLPDRLLYRNSSSREKLSDPRLTGQVLPVRLSPPSWMVTSPAKIYPYSFKHPITNCTSTPNLLVLLHHRGHSTHLLLLPLRYHWPHERSGCYLSCGSPAIVSTDITPPNTLAYLLSPTHVCLFLGTLSDNNI